MSVFIGSNQNVNMDYVWKKNWAGRYYMDVRVSPFYEEFMDRKISETDLTDSENDRLRSLHDIILGYQRLDLPAPSEIRHSWNILATKRSINDAIRRELLEVNLHGREQEKKFKKRR